MVHERGASPEYPPSIDNDDVGDVGLSTVTPKLSPVHKPDSLVPGVLAAKLLITPEGQ